MPKVNIKFGSEVFNDVERIQISKADSSGAVNYMPFDEVLSIMSGASGAGGAYYENPYLTRLGDVGCFFISYFTTVYLENVEQLGSGVQTGANKLKCVNFIAPKLTSIANYLTIGGDVKVVDFTALTACGARGLAGSSLEAIILRGNAVPTISDIAQQSANKPTVYVPSSMLSAYNADTSWASLVSTKEWTITALEGSQYENPTWFKNL